MPQRFFPYTKPLNLHFRNRFNNQVSIFEGKTNLSCLPIADGLLVSERHVKLLI